MELLSCRGGLADETISIVYNSFSSGPEGAGEKGQVRSDKEDAVQGQANEGQYKYLPD